MPASPTAGPSTPPAAPTPAGTPAAPPPAIAAALAQIGIREMEDTLGIEHPGPTEAVAATSGGLFIRGARQGGSPFLNLLSRLTFVVAFALIAALGYGLYRIVHVAGDAIGRMSVSHVFHRHAAAPAPTVVVTTPGATICEPTPQGARVEGLAIAPAVALGAKALPRDPAVIRATPGAGSTVDRAGNRFDVFAPPGARLAVWYAGRSTHVRRVSVRFDTPQPFCVALEQVGLLDTPAAFALDGEQSLHPAGGTPADFFTRGTVQITFEGAGVRLLQLTPR